MDSTIIVAIIGAISTIDVAVLGIISTNKTKKARTHDPVYNGLQCLLRAEIIRSYEKKDSVPCMQKRLSQGHITVITSLAAMMLLLTCTIKLWIWAKVRERKDNMNKIDWRRKLTSRKLWVSVAGFIAGLFIAFGVNNDTANTVSGCIM